MDLLSTVRKSGSRGGVNFSWDDVATSAHRENYLGHSLKAPVGRWAKGRDLNWYAKADATAADSGETQEERDERERLEEIRKVKEAEEDAIARALGLPIKERNVTGANALEIDGSKVPSLPVEDPREATVPKRTEAKESRNERHRDPERRHRRRHRSRDRDHGHDRDGRHRRDRQDRSRSRSPERTKRGTVDTKESDRRIRRTSRSAEAKERHRSRSRDADERREQRHRSRRRDDRRRSRSRDRYENRRPERPAAW